MATCKLQRRGAAAQCNLQGKSGCGERTTWCSGWWRGQCATILGWWEGKGRWVGEASEIEKGAFMNVPDLGYFDGFYLIFLKYHTSSIFVKIIV